MHSFLFSGDCACRHQSETVHRNKVCPGSDLHSIDVGKAVSATLVIKSRLLRRIPSVADARAAMLAANGNRPPDLSTTLKLERWAKAAAQLWSKRQRQVPGPVRSSLRPVSNPSKADCPLRWLHVHHLLQGLRDMFRVDVRSRACMSISCRPQHAPQQVPPLMRPCACLLTERRRSCALARPLPNHRCLQMVHQRRCWRRFPGYDDV